MPNLSLTDYIRNLISDDPKTATDPLLIEYPEGAEPYLTGPNTNPIGFKHTTNEAEVIVPEPDECPDCLEAEYEEAWSGWGEDEWVFSRDEVNEMKTEPPSFPDGETYEFKAKADPRTEWTSTREEVDAARHQEHIDDVIEDFKMTIIDDDEVLELINVISTVYGATGGALVEACRNEPYTDEIYMALEHLKTSALYARLAIAKCFDLKP